MRFICDASRRLTPEVRVRDSPERSALNRVENRPFRSSFPRDSTCNSIAREKTESRYVSFAIVDTSRTNVVHRPLSSTYIAENDESSLQRGEARKNRREKKVTQRDQLGLPIKRRKKLTETPDLTTGGCPTATIERRTATVCWPTLRVTLERERGTEREDGLARRGRARYKLTRI